MPGRKNRKWEGYKQQHAQKRRRKEEKLPDSVEYLTVQRLTAEVEGKCQKYGRVEVVVVGSCFTGKVKSYMQQFKALNLFDAGI